MKFNWNYPTTVWVGENRINELRDACKNLNLTKPLFVTDKDLINLPFIKNIVSKNLKKFDNFTIFSNFTGNPTGENVDEGVEEFKKNNCDGVIAIGGGSAHRQIASSYLLLKSLIQKGEPVIHGGANGLSHHSGMGCLVEGAIRKFWGYKTIFVC